MADAIAMIARCFRGQHPDEFGREYVAPVIVRENSIEFEREPSGETVPSDEEGFAWA